MCRAVTVFVELVQGCQQRDCAGALPVLCGERIGREAGRMRLVIIESPYAGDTPEEVAQNERYARACMRDCLRRGEAPLASHLLYTQPGVLDDADPEERALGITAGLAWARWASATAAYVDLGVTNGMRQGFAHARQLGRVVETRTLSSWRAGLR